MTIAIRIREHGDAAVLKPEDIGPVAPGRGEVRVAQRFVGVNFIDVYHRTGLYPNPLPLIPGIEGAGVVMELGPDVNGLAVGDRVAYAGILGGYAAERVIAAARLVRLPDDISDLDAAAIMVCGITAEYLVQRTFRPKAGDWVLFHAGAGGVGMLAVPWLASMGARVIATASTAEKRALACRLGAEHAVDYGAADWPTQVRTLTGGVGVAVAYDGVGRATYLGSMDALRQRGMLVLFGNASGAVPPIDPLLLSAKGSLFLTRPTLAHYISTPEDLIGASHAVFDALRRGILPRQHPTIYSLTDAAQAHEFLESRQSTGSIVLRV